MSWAMQRREIIIGIIVVFLLLVGTLIAFPIFYHAPSCTDGKQNQKEDGIDCGGPCDFQCNFLLADPNPPRFTRPLAPSIGRTDVIAYVDNPNQNIAARGAEYTVELRDANNAVVATKSGTVDLFPRGNVVPIFISNIFTGNTVVTNAFLSINTATSSLHWYTYHDDRVILKVKNTRVEDTATPRVMATLENPFAEVLTNVKVIATVFDANGTAVAASQTILPMVPPQGDMDAVFTWNTPFTSRPTRIDIVPIIPLPRI